MAGHSQFKNIMHRKGAQDAKRAKVFTKLIRELTVAARGSPDPDTNPRLRTAIVAARQANMPKDTMERAILRGSGGADGDNYEAVRYEGYGPGGVAIIVEALTDNRNRTAPEIRSAFSKYGGNLGETNSVSFQFEQVGQIDFEDPQQKGEDLFNTIVEAGAEDMVEEENGCQVFTEAKSLHKVSGFLEEKLGEPSACKLVWRPVNTVAVNEDQIESLLKLIDLLEDNDDVQAVFSNFDVDPEVLKRVLSS